MFSTRSYLLGLALLAGCGGTAIDQLAHRLEVYPIAGLPAYDGGRVMRPWHLTKPDRDRFAHRTVGKAADPMCWWGDDFFRDCRIYECEMPSATCPTGAKCWDVSIKFDPEDSIEPYGPSGPAWSPAGDRYEVMHQPTCLIGGR